MTDVPELRIIAEKLWQEVQARRESQRRLGRGARGGQPKYLLSGLLVCGSCGSPYIMKTGGYYGCSNNINRGAAVCGNTRLARRDVAEQRIIRTVREQIFASDHIRYLTRRINAALARHRTRAAQVANERILRDAENEAGNLMAAIRAGAGDIPELVDQLRSAKERLERLQAQRQRPPAKPVRILPAAVLRILDHLQAWLESDVERARTLLHQLLGPIRLEPAEDGLYAVISGNVSGMLQLAGVRWDIRWGEPGAGRPALQLPTRVYRIPLPHSSRRHGRESSETS